MFEADMLKAEMFQAQLLAEIRSRFAHVDQCPYQGKRIYFENAGGSLKLKSVLETTAQLQAIPDNYGRVNAASQALTKIVEAGRRDMMLFMGASRGQVIVGETGTELLFRLIRSAALHNTKGGNIVGSRFEHPSTMSAGRRWAVMTNKAYLNVSYDNEHGGLDADDFRRVVTPETRVATINHTNPLTGVSMDVAEIARAIKDISAECFIIVDGIQHAPHGAVVVDEYGVDAYVVSGYKMFSRHNYGMAWISPELSRVSHDHLDGTAEDFWELGTRDVANYAATSEVVNYLDWLGSQFSDSNDLATRLGAAGRAIHAQEAGLLKAMLQGVDDQAGLANIPGVSVLSGVDNPLREGVVSFVLEGMDSLHIVKKLDDAGIRVHIRNNDYYSGAVLGPLGLESCVRVSLCHYNSLDEVKLFLLEINKLIKQ